jgi:hypothetical protein
VALGRFSVIGVREAGLAAPASANRGWLARYRRTSAEDDDEPEAETETERVAATR